MPSYFLDHPQSLALVLLEYPSTLKSFDLAFASFHMLTKPIEQSVRFPNCIVHCFRFSSNLLRWERLLVSYTWCAPFGLFVLALRVRTSPLLVVGWYRHGSDLLEICVDLLDRV